MTHPQDRVSEDVQHPQEENPWLEILKTLGLSAVLAFGIRTFVAEARYIPSGSMLPTLQINDRLIIDKIGYHFQDLQRGDIVVFKPTEKLKEENYKDAFIKRTIGLPGDLVEIRDAQVYINGERLEEPYIADASKSWEGVADGTRVDVCKNSKNKIPYFSQKEGGDQVIWEAMVPPNSYLVMGDNRNNSYDSRCWGVVPREDIIGRAVLRFWPLNRLGGINP